jgi:hypothetical protein
LSANAIEIVREKTIGWWWCGVREVVAAQEVVLVGKADEDQIRQMIHLVRDRE